MKLSAARLDAIVWSLIFGGFFVVGMGIALAKGGASWGTAVLAAGVVCIAAGIALIWVRSRMPSR